MILDGKAVAGQRLDQLKNKVSQLQKGPIPGLAVIRVGEDPASKVYVGHKIKACQRVGIHSEEKLFDASISQEELFKEIDLLNDRPDIHGILVQLPLPPHIHVGSVIERVRPEKDVDGFHPMNLGRLAAMEEALYPCTPLGIMNLLQHYGIDVSGKKAVVVGRSRIVGRPMSLMLDQAGATVTVVHKSTPEPEKVTSSAEILVVAAGQRHLVKASGVKEGAVVIDVGMHRTEDNKLTGDVDFAAVKDKTSAITPVPGGVGPMTICSLLENTLKAFEISKNKI